MAANVPDAIAERLEDTPALYAAVPGRLWFERNPSNPVVPWGRIHRLAGSDHENTSGRAYWREERYQVSFFAEAVSQLETIGSLFKDTFHPKAPRLVMDDSSQAHVRVTGPIVHLGEDPEATQANGRAVRHAYVELLVVTNRGYPQGA